LVKRAQEEGIAVDLDELAAVGRNLDEEGRPRPRYIDRSDRTRSFDELVGSDGMLITRSVVDEGAVTSSTAENAGNATMRQRTRGERGMAQGFAFANPFIEEEIGAMFFDQAQAEAPAEPSVSVPVPSLIDMSEPDQTIPEGARGPRQSTDRERSVTLAADDPPVSLPVSTLEQEISLLLEREAAESARWAEDVSAEEEQDQMASFHSAASDLSSASSDPFASLHALDTTHYPETVEESPSTPGAIATPLADDEDFDDGFITAGSVVDSQPSNDHDLGERDGDILSEAGNDESGSTESFSEVTGIRTPSEASWTDVSGDGSEYGWTQGQAHGNGSIQS